MTETNKLLFFLLFIQPTLFFIPIVHEHIRLIRNLCCLQYIDKIYQGNILYNNYTFLYIILYYIISYKSYLNIHFHTIKKNLLFTCI
jgi:hypothetical protein